MVKSSYRLATVWGIPLRVHISLIVLLILFALSSIAASAGIRAIVALLLLEVGIFTSVALHELGQVFHRTHHCPGMPFQRGLAPAEQPRLVGEHLHEHPVSHPGVTDKRLDLGDLHGNTLEQKETETTEPLLPPFPSVQN